MTESLFEKNKTKLFWGVVLASSMFYLIIAVNFPLSINADAVHDDMLFIERAYSLANGNWLGAYNQMTLPKGPGYPAFLALNYWMGLSISLSHALFLCISLILFSFLIFRISGSLGLAISIFLIPLWDPRVFQMSRVIRDMIYSGQTILVLMTLFYFLFPFPKKTHQGYVGVISGILFGWFWLTREEGAWLLPGILILFLIAGIDHYRSRDLKNLLKKSSVFLSTFIVILVLFRTANFLAYGSFVGVEQKEKSFTSALSDMQSVISGESIPYLSVPQATRQMIYEVSPSFAELQPFLEQDGFWKNNNCSGEHVICDDISDGWFPWAVRDAVARRGYYDSPENAQQFYLKISAEIELACKSGALSCGKSNIPYVPPSIYDQFSKIPAVLLSSWQSLSLTPDWGEYDKISSGDEIRLNRALSILNYPISYPLEDQQIQVAISGWYVDEEEGSNSWFVLEIEDGRSENLRIIPQRLESIDITTIFNDDSLNYQRFSTLFSCTNPCNMNIVSPDGSEITIPLETKQKRFILNGNIFNIGSLITNLDNNSENSKVGFSTALVKKLNSIYFVILPYLLNIGFLSFVFCLLLSIRKRKISVLLSISGILWLSAFSRLALLTLFDLSSFSAIKDLYLLPAFTLSLIASILSLFLSAKPLKVFYLYLVRNKDSIQRQ